tara:strand:+ start:2485 stop:3324 length:840 start_codon:yes stop_codon:yes gene_type:complete
MRLLAFAVTSILFATCHPLSATTENDSSAILFNSESEASCTFDRTSASLVRQGESLVAVAHVHCQHTSTPTLFTTLPPSHISPGGLSLSVGSSPQCDGKTLDSATPLTLSADTPLYFCVNNAENLNGVIPVSVGESKHSYQLPQGAISHSVLFEHNSHALTDSAIAQLKVALSQFGPHQAYQFDLYGHASVVGDAKYNYDLSVMRLAAVRQWLISNTGIKKSQTWGQAYGNQRPANLKGDDIKTMEHDNRRVRIVAYPKSTTSTIEASPAKRINFSDTD